MGQAGLRLSFVASGIWTGSYARSAECDRTRRRGAAGHGIPAIPRAPSWGNRAHRDCARRTSPRFNLRDGPRVHRHLQRARIQIRTPRPGGIPLRLDESNVDCRTVAAETGLKDAHGRIRGAPGESLFTLSRTGEMGYNQRRFRSQNWETPPQINPLTLTGDLSHANAVHSLAVFGLRDFVWRNRRGRAKFSPASSQPSLKSSSKIYCCTAAWPPQSWRCQRNSGSRFPQ